MPKQPVEKSSTNAARESAAKPEKKSPVASTERAAALTQEQKRTIVHNCIAGCAGHENFGRNTPLRNIVAAPECVRRCILENTGRNLLLDDTDTENLIVGML